MKKTFRGGTHPPEAKLSAGRSSERLPLPDEVVIPVAQHIGAPGKVVVAKKDEVKAGQVIIEASGFVSVPAHAPISGTVTAVGEVPGPMGRPIEAVTIKSDGEDSWDEAIVEDENWADADPDLVRDRVRDAGLVGLGGAMFPTHVKLSPPSDKPIRTVIINGAECEPYLTSDHRMMLERPRDVLEGARLVTRTVGAERCIVGIESNKPDAARVMREAAADFDEISVEVVPVKYPQGAEKQLIVALTGREVPPPPKLPMDVGCLVQNIASCVAIYEAVRYRRPLVERLVTVTGSGVREPKNVIARLGTSMKTLIEAAGGYTEDAAKLISGGPMMGIAVWSDQLPIIKGTGGILVLGRKQARKSVEQPCIACGQCVEVCPVFLLPTTIARHSQLERFDDAEAIGALECIECGSCTYVCPSRRNLVQHIRFGKQAIMAKKRKQAVQKKTA